MIKIDKTAVIDSRAKIGKNVVVGPWSVIGPDVVIADNNWIGPHVVINGHTSLGEHNKIYQFSSIGEAPQHIDYHDEPTKLIIGSHNVIREFTTINRGTVFANSQTLIGDHNYFMAYVHVAHDCHIKDNVIMANGATLGGHVEVGNYVVIGGSSVISQYCMLGDHSFVAGASAVTKDIPAFINASGQIAKVVGFNRVGLKQRNFSSDVIKNITDAFRILYRKKLTVKEALLELNNKVSACPEIQLMIDSVERSTRGIIR